MIGIKERYWVDDDQDILDLVYEVSVKVIVDVGI